MFGIIPASFHTRTHVCFCACWRHGWRHCSDGQPIQLSIHGSTTPEHTAVFAQPVIRGLVVGVTIWMCSDSWDMTMVSNQLPTRDAHILWGDAEAQLLFYPRHHGRSHSLGCTGDPQNHWLMPLVKWQDAKMWM